MADATLHSLGVIFAIVSATGAGLLALLFWQVLRESPFGTIVALLSGTMSAMIVYHAILFVVEPNSVVLDVLRSALYTVAAIVLWLAIAAHRRIEYSAMEG